MKTFKEFTSKRPVLSIIEPVKINDIGVISAKVDSGNEAYNVIHGTDISFGSDKTVTFKTVGDKEITKPVVGSINIHIGSGVKEDRPLVEFDIEMHGEVYKDVPFSIADRSENTEPILIGEPFLKKINALIDTSLDVNR
jgi:hypothetical protein